MGIVLLEAMASGVPLVASAIPGYTTVIEPGKDGLLTHPGNTHELAQAIGELLDNQLLRQKLVAGGLQKVLTYAWPHVAQQIEAYYVSLLPKHQYHTHNLMSGHQDVRS
jgi:glycosyltransferase involved in cell wall biosynthesis